MRFEIVVNGTRHAIDGDPGRSLLGVLHDELGLTGTKYGCGEGQCSACTVLVGDKAVHSCRTPLTAVDGLPVTTIEGLEKDGKLHPVQEAFMHEVAMQCGYCTAGMIMQAVALLRATPRPTREQIVDGMQGNVCRCGTYPRIVAAVERASHESTASAEGRP